MNTPLLWTGVTTLLTPTITRPESGLQLSTPASGTIINLPVMTRGGIILSEVIYG